MPQTRYYEMTSFIDDGGDIPISFNEDRYYLTLTGGMEEIRAKGNGAISTLGLYESTHCPNTTDLGELDADRITWVWYGSPQGLHESAIESCERGIRRCHMSIAAFQRRIAYYKSLLPLDDAEDR